MILLILVVNLSFDKYNQRLSDMAPVSTNKILIDHSSLEKERNMSIKNCNNNKIIGKYVNVKTDTEEKDSVVAVKVDRFKNNKGNMNIMNSLYLETEDDADWYMKMREQQAIREIRTLAVSQWLLQLPYTQDDDFSTTSVSTNVDSTESYSTDKYIEIHSESDKDTFNISTYTYYVI